MYANYNDTELRKFFCKITIQILLDYFYRKNKHLNNDRIFCTDPHFLEF